MRYGKSTHNHTLYMPEFEETHPRCFCRAFYQIHYTAHQSDSDSVRKDFKVVTFYVSVSLGLTEFVRQLMYMLM